MRKCRYQVHPDRTIMGKYNSCNVGQETKSIVESRTFIPPYGSINHELNRQPVGLIGQRTIYTRLDRPDRDHYLFRYYRQINIGRRRKRYRERGFDFFLLGRIVGKCARELYTTMNRSLIVGEFYRRRREEDVFSQVNNYI